MADQEMRCLPPCQRQLPDDDLHAFCFEYLGEEHASLEAHGDRVPIWPRHVRRTCPFLLCSRRIMKPLRPFLKRASSERAEET